MGRKIKKVIVLSLAFMLSVMKGWSQMTLSGECNIPRNGDNVIRREVMHAVPGTGGSGVIWDFSRNDLKGEEHTVEYIHMCDSNDVLSKASERSLTHYYIDGDSVFFLGYEDNDVRIVCNDTILSMTFPFSYGDSVTSGFGARGIYYDKMPFQISGAYKHKADGYGTLILPDCDTLKNVLRTCEEWQRSDSNMKVFHWYSPLYRYPVLETFLFEERGATKDARSYYYSMEPLAESVYDGSNDFSSPVSCTKSHVESNSPFTYTLNLSRLKNLGIRCCTEGNADFSYSLCALNGVVIESKNCGKLKSGYYSVNIDMSHLNEGIYLLDLQVGSMRKTEKIELTK